ncbi:MAG TPA: hypothetical protein VF572_03505 [Candidatus Saccharimonadales bacterium]
MNKTQHGFAHLVIIYGLEEQAVSLGKETNDARAPSDAVWIRLE